MPDPDEIGKLIGRLILTAILIILAAGILIGVTGKSVFGQDQAFKLREQMRQLEAEAEKIEEAARIENDKKGIVGSVGGHVEITVNKVNEEWPTYVHEKHTIHVMTFEKEKEGEVPTLKPFMQLETDDLGRFEWKNAPYGHYLLGVKYKDKWIYRAARVTPSYNDLDIEGELWEGKP